MNQGSKTIVWVIVVLLVVWAGYSLFSNGVGNSSVKIGVMQPLTGDIATIGQNIKAAIEVAAEEVNVAGGIAGKKVELVVEDSKCNAKDAANAINKLVNIDKVKVVIGGGCSSETLAAAPVTETAKVILFSPASTNPKIADAGDYVFRNVPSDSFQGAYAAGYIKDTLKKSKVAVLKSQTDWSIGVTDAFKAKFIELGGTIVAEESFVQDAKDLRSQLAKIKAAKPELVYFAAYTEGAIVGIKQMKELGITAQIFGADTMTDAKIWSEVGNAGNGVMYSEPANREISDELMQKIVAKIGGGEMNVYAPRAYDVMKILAFAMNKAGVETDKIRDELYALRDYQGAADVYSFDPRGEVMSAVYAIKQIKDGKMVEVK